MEAKGEVAALGDTINDMTDTLAIFAEQVTNVAREVGVEGRLGGQAHVPGAAGTWKDLTGNVNLLAANLTTQVRAITEVATAVTKGDLTRSIQVDARGEVSELKDNINTMIYNLRVTTESNQEQDWLKTNLAKFTRMLQGQRDLFVVGKMLLSELAPLVEAQQGTIYQMVAEEGKKSSLRLLAGYAQRSDQAEWIRAGEGLVEEHDLFEPAVKPSFDDLVERRFGLSLVDRDRADRLTLALDLFGRHVLAPEVARLSESDVERDLVRQLVRTTGELDEHAVHAPAVLHVEVALED